MFSGVKNAVRNVLSGGKKLNTVTDPKTGQTYKKPSYGAVSAKGLTSNDPANVARNRAAAAKYAAMAAARPDRPDRTAAGAATAAATTPVVRPTMTTTPTAPAAPTMMYVPAPAGYRPGVDPEHSFYQPKPTITLAKGGRVKPKRAK
jgi:hypothetical protein